MPIGHLWAGSAYGTNNGRLFVELEGADEALRGVLRLNDPDFGLIVFNLEAAFDGTELALSGEPQAHREGLAVGNLAAHAVLGPDGELRGRWATDIGAAGTFLLFPHDQIEAAPPAEQGPLQLHTARHHFGAITIDRGEIVALAEGIQRDFRNGRVVVTVATALEQSRYLEDFEKAVFSDDRAKIIKLHVQEQDATGLNRMVTVEFGPFTNIAITQAADEAWALGRLETLKRDIGRYERAYATNFWHRRFGVVQFLIIATFVYLPSLVSLRDRAILAGVVFALVWLIDAVHRRYIPFAVIYLGKRPTGWARLLAPVARSWLIAATAGAVAAMVAAYLQGAFPVLQGNP